MNTKRNMNPTTIHTPSSHRLGGASGKAVGGGLVVAALLVLGSYLGGLGFGVGGGSGDGDGDSPPNLSGVQGTIDSETPTTPDETELEIGTVVNVLIDGSQYRILKSPEASWTDTDNYTAISLERVLSAVQNADGDSGVKIRIARRGNSLPEAELKLREALRDAGIEATEIEERDMMLP
ncbi:hypothetical protein [Thalassoroseus pseudoceratinae]|uniref:hypothetical protein n=1 Tax=Thalassoroseus pseudoceratinae TaxID=2713176 RepID=UPI0014226E8A|nr:hypothetical protein [Thalassoroseus pseudoceratinae]